jgi:hypothetical protein
MRALQDAAERRASSAQRRLIGMLADHWIERLKAVDVRIREAELEIRGREVRKRWLTDPALRFASYRR